MAKIKLPAPVKLFAGVIYSSREHLDQAIEQLREKFGGIDESAGPFPFTHTRYYQTMGGELFKYFISFSDLIERETINDIKIFSNNLENEISAGERIINIDPGYLSLSNVYLASCKEYYHRIYVGKGIYLENEYYYSKGEFRFFEWTYPDYKSREYLSFFHNLRERYHAQIIQKAGKD